MLLHVKTALNEFSVATDKGLFFAPMVQIADHAQGGSTAIVKERMDTMKMISRVTTSLSKQI